jgi:hypothetical protein
MQTNLYRGRSPLGAFCFLGCIRPLIIAQLKTIQHIVTTLTKL